MMTYCLMSRADFERHFPEEAAKSPEADSYLIYGVAVYIAESLPDA